MGDLVWCLQEDEDMAGDVRDGRGRGEGLRRGGEVDVRGEGEDQLPLRPQHLPFPLQLPLGRTYRQAAPVHQHGFHPLWPAAGGDAGQDVALPSFN